jgi:hypothetical protein
MNERIDELSKQAELYAVADNSSMLFDVWKKRYTEKLAELIVKECARVLVRHGAYFFRSRRTLSLCGEFD